MSERCELTDLLVEQCAHCLRHPEAFDYMGSAQYSEQAPYGPRE